MRCTALAGPIPRVTLFQPSKAYPLPLPSISTPTQKQRVKKKQQQMSSFSFERSGFFCPLCFHRSSLLVPIFKCLCIYFLVAGQGSRGRWVLIVPLLALVTLLLSFMSFVQVVWGRFPPHLSFCCWVYWPLPSSSFPFFFLVTQTKKGTHTSTHSLSKTRCVTLFYSSSS